MRRAAPLLLVAMSLCLAAATTGCGVRLFGGPSVEQPDYTPDVAWSPASGTTASMNASTAAEAMLPRFAATGALSDVTATGSRDVTMPPVGGLRITRIAQRYRVDTASSSLKPMGWYDIAVTAGGRTVGVFAMKRTGQGWEYCASGYTASWWGWDMYKIAALPGDLVELRLVSGTGPLSWYIVRTTTGEYAFPSVHMGPVSIAKPRTDEWKRIEIRAYPMEAVFSRIRWDGC